MCEMLECRCVHLQYLGFFLLIMIFFFFFFFFFKGGGGICYVDIDVDNVRRHELVCIYRL